MSEAKIFILNLIKENKEILFGKFSSDLTHEVKIKKWKYIAEKAKVNGICCKNWKYLRDTTWQNWRKRAIEKKDNIIKTGGKKFKYDEADVIIFEIIRKDSPSLDGLYVADSSVTDSEKTTAVLDHNKSLVVENTPIESISNAEISPKIDDNSKRSCINKKRNITYIRKRRLMENSLMPLKKGRLENENILLKEKIQISKREKYKLDLELFKLEKELKLPPSEFTKEFHELTFNEDSNHIYFKAESED